MTKPNTSHLAIATSIPSPQEAFDDVRNSFERFCRLSGIEAVKQMLEAKKGFRRIRAYKQLPQLRAALLEHQERHQETANLDRQAKAA